ncbi:asparaginase II [Fusarium mundagurra]|uniref:Asparaginase II n=1 Tax=Fusarium mundagurra TaxID=1567541 RepID=A0A8H5Y3U1_9HYPO|nr:asparaginase II [Fusarium mundagurra]
MAGAEASGADIKSYHLPDHPVQLEVKRVVDDLAHDPKQVEWGVNGCNLPAPAYPLSYLAQKYATFADAADAVEASSPASQRTRNFARVFNPMTEHPEQVGGTGRFCTVLMQSYQGQLFGKVGADASYGIGVRESENTLRRGAKGAHGIAVKIEDGNLEMLYAVIPEILEQLEIGTPEQRRRLDGFIIFSGGIL